MRFAAFALAVAAAAAELSITEYTAHHNEEKDWFWCSLRNPSGKLIHTEGEPTPAKAFANLIDYLSHFVTLPTLTAEPLPIYQPLTSHDNAA